MRISVIVPSRERRDSLRQCLAALRAQERAADEIVVVDDGSRDQTAAMVRAEFPEVRLVVLPRSQGPAAARNRGIRAAAGDLLAFTDDDCVPPPDWLRRHERLHSGPDVGAVGGVQVPRRPDAFQRFDQSRAAAWTTAGPEAEPRSVEELYANNLSVRREVFERAGLFDERFRSGEDPELTRRIARAGYRLIGDPGLRVDHARTHTLGSYVATRFRRGCGSVLADREAGTLRARRFIPLVSPARLADQWRNHRRLFDGGPAELLRFLAIAWLSRFAEVAGRAYYAWTLRRRAREA